MEDLTAWLRATIEGDKAAAEANGDESWTAHDEGEYDNWTIVTGDQGFKQGDSYGCCCKGTLDEVVAKHMALHDPRDTIARCEAELALLDDYEQARVAAAPIRAASLPAHMSPRERAGYSQAETSLRRAVERLAAGRRHRPGFNPAWLD